MSEKIGLVDYKVCRKWLKENWSKMNYC
jgi:hypothetical protein